MTNAVVTQDQNRRGRQAEQSRPYVIPPANITAGQNEYVVELEMPGVRKEDIDITTQGGELIIVGRRRADLPDGELCYCESALADYRRTFEIGPDIDTSKITAEMQQGVLRLRLAKSERAKPRKIQITG